ncbi:biotin/lipoyl-containing protein [Ruania alba]|uniref:biotin/lipoyl-containing protein n=1 Tax=Ruania alba TaxID=648782 RepID=UPI001FDEF4A8|nr:biotin/lipoyl-containing protein [Ruania alba]
MDRALAETVILGLHTNVDYLRAVLAAPEVLAGTADTTLLDRIGGASGEQGDSEQRLPGALIAAALTRHAQAWTDDLWHQPSGWRLGRAEPVEYTYSSGDQVHRVLVTGPPTAARVEGAATIDGPEHSDARFGTISQSAVDSCSHQLRLDGVVRRVWVWEGTDGTWVRLNGRTTVLTRPRDAPAASGPGAVSGPELRTPMPGTVVAVHVHPGAPVEPGDLVVTVEAMKMEHQIRAASAGTISLDVAVGDLVRTDQVLGVVSGPESPQDTAEPSAVIHKI